jgi:elongation factor Ts
MLPGAVTSYIHPGGEVGVLVEINCESDFIATTDRFRELMREIALQIAASGPKFIRKGHVSPGDLERELDKYRIEAAATGKPTPVVEKIVAGKMAKFYEDVCLYEQPFIKDRSISVSQFISSIAEELGEKIRVRRFARFKVGSNDTTLAIDLDSQPEGEEGTGITAKRPKFPKAGAGSAAAKLDSESE